MQTTLTDIRVRGLLITGVVLVGLALGAWAYVWSDTGMQGWLRDDLITVTTATTFTDTSLITGTVYQAAFRGWDKVVVHNRDSTDWVGLLPRRFGESEGSQSTRDTFDEMTIALPPDGTVEITKEALINLRTVADNGTPIIYIERAEKI